MATEITNQAFLTYKYGDSTGTAVSNIASTTLEGSLSADKTSLSDVYRVGDEITYLLTLTNKGGSTLTNVVVTDDLGTYETAGSVQVTPLTYTGPSRLHVNGVYRETIVPTIAANSITYNIASIPVGDTYTIIFKAKVNDYALRNQAAEIVNTATFRADGITEPLEASHTLKTLDYADVRIVKSMSPDPVMAGGTLTYKFELSNYGNIDATRVVLTDDFNPAPSDITVMVGNEVVPPSQYTYSNGRLTLPGGEGSTLSITVPKAEFSQNASTGLVTVTPGVEEITVTGTI